MVAERFGDILAVDTVTVAQKFYQSHEDAYDYLVIYNNLDIDVSPTAVAVESTVRNNRSGYGDRQIDVGAEYGSNSRLQAVLTLGPLSQYPRDPDALVPRRRANGDTPLTILGHETDIFFWHLPAFAIRTNRQPAPCWVHKWRIGVSSSIPKRR